MIDRRGHVGLLVPRPRVGCDERSNGFSTEHFRTRDQYDAWREWFGSGFEIRPEGSENLGFNAQYTAWQVGGLVVTSLAAPPVHAVRQPTHLRHSPVDHWVITYCRDSSTHFETGRGELEVRKGVPFLWSLGEPSQHSATRCPGQKTAGDNAERLQLCLPRDSFPDMAAGLDSAVGTMLDTPTGRLLGDFLFSLVREMPAIADGEVPALEAALRSLVACVIKPSADTLAQAHPKVALRQLDVVRRVVQNNLRSPRLEVNMLCREAAMSRSALYRLLEPQGGVARFIQRARLNAALEVLRNLADSTSISSIAEDFCFSSSSAFSRAFRTEFGFSPRDARSADQVEFGRK